MNNARRKEIAKIIAELDKMRDAVRDGIMADLDSIQGEEQDAFDGLSEKAQEGEKGQKAQAALEALQAAYDDLDGIDFDSIIGNLNTASE